MRPNGGAITAVRRYLSRPYWSPANPSAPEAITSLTLAAGGSGKELAEWSRGRRVTYKRVFIKVEGVDTDFRFVDRTSDLEMTLKSLTPGSTIHVYVIAANEGGEAPPSPAVTKVVGA